MLESCCLLGIFGALSVLGALPIVSFSAVVSLSAVINLSAIVTLLSLAADITLLREVGRAMRNASICGLGQTAWNAVESAIDRLGAYE